MTKTPQTANRYLVKCFVLPTGRWLTDTAYTLELAREWAQDWVRHPDRYSEVSIFDLQQHLVLSVFGPRTYRSEQERNEP